jgi:hypothetical protein
LEQTVFYTQDWKHLGLFGRWILIGRLIKDTFKSVSLTDNWTNGWLLSRTLDHLGSLDFIVILDFKKNEVD